jgi:hypothetical protein
MKGCAYPNFVWILLLYMKFWDFTDHLNLSVIFYTELQPQHVDVHSIPLLITSKIPANKEIKGDARKFREPGTLCRYRH